MAVLTSDWTMPMAMVPYVSLSQVGAIADDDVLWLASLLVEYHEPSMEPQIWIVGINPELAKEGLDPSSAQWTLPVHPERQPSSSVVVQMMWLLFACGEPAQDTVVPTPSIMSDYTAFEDGMSRTYRNQG